MMITAVQFLQWVNGLVRAHSLFSRNVAVSVFIYSQHQTDYDQRNTCEDTQTYMW